MVALASPLAPSFSSTAGSVEVELICTLANGDGACTEAGRVFLLIDKGKIAAGVKMDTNFAVKLRRLSTVERITSIEMKPHASTWLNDLPGSSCSVVKEALIS